MKLSTEYRITDARFPAVEEYIVWLGDSRVLFMGVDLPATLKHPERDHQLATFIWDIKANTVVKYLDERMLRPCYDNGKIIYMTWSFAEKQGTVYSGKLGGERSELVPRGEHVVWNPYDCRIMTAQDRDFLNNGLAGRRFVALRAEHGVAALGTHGERRYRNGVPDTDYQIYSNDLKRSTPLSLDRALDLQPHQWVPSTGEYLFVIFNNPKQLHKAFFVKPNGASREVSLPKRDWKTPPSRHLGARDGLMTSVAGSSSSRHQHPGSDGLYFVGADRFDWLEQGFVPSMSVSPNGCLIAYVYFSSMQGRLDSYGAWRRGEAAGTLRVADVCQRR